MGLFSGTKHTHLGIFILELPPPGSRYIGKYPHEEHHSSKHVDCVYPPLINNSPNNLIRALGLVGITTFYR